MIRPTLLVYKSMTDAASNNFHPAAHGEAGAIVALHAALGVTALYLGIKAWRERELGHAIRDLLHGSIACGIVAVYLLS